MPYPAHTGWLKTHNMCATRFSASQKNGFLRFKPTLKQLGHMSAKVTLHHISFVLALGLNVATAWPTTTAHAAPTPQATPQAAPAPIAAPPASGIPAPAGTTAASPHKPLRPAEQIAQLADQLAHAKTPEEAHALEGTLEALRAAHLSPTTHLLLRRAEKDLANNKPDDAVEDMGDALALQPDEAILWRSRAQMRLVAGDLTGAVKDLGSALQRDAKDSQSWSLLATVEEHRNDGQAALKAWQKVLELNPMADKNHKRLDALHIKAFGQPT